MGQSLIIGLGKGGSVEGIYLGLSKRPRDKHGRYLRPRASWGPCLLEVVFRVGKDPPAFDFLGPLHAAQRVLGYKNRTLGRGCGGEPDKQGLSGSC